jgi:hypothetical protein
MHFYRYLEYIWFLLSAALIIAGVFLLVHLIYMLIFGTKTNGTVVGFELGETSAMDLKGTKVPYHQPIIEFMTASGMVTEKYIKVNPRIKFNFKDGDSVEVKYSNRNPKRFIVLNDEVIFLRSIGLCICGILLATAGVLKFII